MNYFSWLATPYHYLTWFYQYSTGYYSWIYQVFNIKENWISILCTVLLVAIILFYVFNFNQYNK